MSDIDNDNRDNPGASFGTDNRSSSSSKSIPGEVKTCAVGGKGLGNNMACCKRGELWRGIDSVANTEFIMLGGKCHFKSTRIAAREDCMGPFKTIGGDC